MRVEMNWRTRTFVVTLTVLALFGFSGPTSVARADESFAASSASSHAAVVVQKEAGDITTVCVTFASAQITGLQALQLASAVLQPVINASPNYGAAVCALCGQGCSAGDCLTCSNKYWSYWRAPASSSSFSYSGQGVSTSTVRDGYVEGWVWGQGRTAPPSSSFTDICAATIRGEVDATSTTFPMPTSATTSSALPTAATVNVSSTTQQLPAGSPSTTLTVDSATSSTVEGDLTSLPASSTSTSSSTVGIMIGEDKPVSTDVVANGSSDWGSILFPLLGLVLINIAVVWLRMRLRKKRTW